MAEIVDRPSLLCKVSTMRLIPGYSWLSQAEISWISASLADSGRAGTWLIGRNQSSHSGEFQGSQLAREITARFFVLPIRDLQAIM